MTAPTFGTGLYGCCGARKPAGETQNYCPACKREYMAVWRKAHHRRGDPYYERLLTRSRAAGKQRTREARVDREYRSRRVRHSISALNAAGMTCPEIMVALGVTDMTIYDWRSGKRVPTPRNAERLYRLLDAVEAQTASKAAA
ncbi:MAG: hypothetical protein QM692_09235 [Thermomicrobiales bacterium]